MTHETAIADDRARVLADGARMPLIGLGVWQVPDGRERENAVRSALEPAATRARSASRTSA